MTWNWEMENWPHFTWDASKMVPFENAFLEKSGVMMGVSSHISSDDQNLLMVQLMSGEAMDTSEIEGEMLDRGSVQSSIKRHLGFAPDRRKTRPAEDGIAEMMVSLYRTISAPLTEDMLFEWHRMITSGRRDLENVGCYRTHSEPMQIVSGSSWSPKVHYEAPPSSRLCAEMKAFLFWFRDTAPQGKMPLPPVTRAGLAHLYFESIHPFEDGNGRLGRGISEKALAQSLSRPALTSLAPTLLKHRKDYYQQLEWGSERLEMTSWLTWFGERVIESQERVYDQIQFILYKTTLMNRLKGKINERQEKALLRMFNEGVDGFEGGLSAKNYMTITGSPSATATRDLADLVRLRALVKTGENKGVRYFLNRA